MTRHHGARFLPLLLALGCGAPGAEERALGGGDEPELRPVPGDYPYRVGDATVCAEYAIDDGASEPVRRLEFYKLDVIRDELAADPALREHVERTTGLERVDDCESARRYMSARLAYWQRAPLAQEPSGSAPIEELEPEAANKVVGVEAEFPAVVHLWQIGCSGFLIGRRWLVTAAHCRPESGRFALSFALERSGEIHIITPCDKMGANSNFEQARNFVGTGDWVNDFALIEADCDFPWPADSPENWLRLSLTSAWPEQFLAPLGWGRNAHDGSGSGTLRRGEHGIYVGHASRYVFTSVAERRRARICRGDSGGPALNFTSVPGLAIAMGVNLYHAGGSEYCPYPGDVMGFNQIATKLSWIDERFAMGCRTFRSADGTLKYWRCW